MDDLPKERSREEDPAPAYLSCLNEETMSLAWGEEKTPEYRRRVVSAAIIFSRQLEERMSESPPDTDEISLQRFLMALMNSAIQEFAQSEDMDEAVAAEFLGNVETRDHVLEFNEVLDEYHDAPDGTLDELLRKTIGNRRNKAIWAQHWSSG